MAQMLLAPPSLMSALLASPFRETEPHPQDDQMDNPIIYHLAKSVLKCDQNSRSTIISI
jgi:hypothetical protein